MNVSASIVRKRSTSAWRADLGANFFLIIIAFFTFLPFYFMLITSVKTTS